MTGISQREFARREQCDEKLVRRKVASGHLIANDDGTLDPDLIGTAWRRRPNKTSNVDPEPDTEKELASLIVADPTFIMLSKADAEAKKENYLALLRQLEYDTKSGAVVLVEDVASAVTNVLSVVRNKLLSIPTRVAPRAAILKTAVEIQSLIESEIAEVLTELVYDIQSKEPL